MSETRNTGMIMFIIGVIVVSSITIAGLVYFASTNFPNDGIGPIGDPNWDNTTAYSFTRTETTMPASVDLDIDLDVGGVNVIFIDDPTLLYQIDMIVPNRTIELHGAPSVAYIANTITLDYQVAGVNVTLGNATCYSFDLDVITGGVGANLNGSACVSDVDLNVVTGGISLGTTNDVTLVGNVTFSIRTVTGGVSVNAALPADIGGSFEGSTTTGSIDVTAPGWTEITPSHYETSDYDTASQTVTIIAIVTTGGISATLS
ncbi:MAG: hypothetical protein ACW97A_01790 [Candidatus Thorarchaeota archaeon]|jgi:hypothetical protein